MKVVFTAKGDQWDSPIDERFGRAEYLLLYDEDTKTLKSNDNRENAFASHGAGPKTAQLVFNLKPAAIVTGNGPGEKAAKALERAGADIFVGAGGMTVKEAYEAFKAGNLEKY